jgi:hypothetical protein
MPHAAAAAHTPASTAVCIAQVTERWSSSDLVRAGVPRFLLEEIYAAMGKVGMECKNRLSRKGWGGQGQNVCVKVGVGAGMAVGDWGGGRGSNCMRKCKTVQD